MRGRRVKTQADVDRYVKQGFGQGNMEDYQPWLRVQDVPSRGRSRKVHGSKVDRLYHLLSDLEFAQWLQLDFSENVVDIREQFPLFPVTALEAIASSLGYKYPVYVGTKVPYVMTTDFVITLRQADGGTRLEARTVKPYAEVAGPSDQSRRTLEKLEIEERYWQSQGVKWHVITERNLPAILTKNLDWLRKGLTISKALQEQRVLSLFIAELSRARHFQWTLGKTLRHISSRMFIPYEECSGLFRYVVWHKCVVVDLSRPLTITGPFPDIDIRQQSVVDSHFLEVI